MVGLLTNILGGGLEGAGAGLVLDGKQKREAALKELEREHQLTRDELRETGATKRQEIGITASDKRQERADKAARERLDIRLRSDRERDKEKRGLLKDIVRAEDGTLYTVTADGKFTKSDIKGTTGRSASAQKQPADVVAAQWLAEQRAAIDGRDKPTAQELVDSFQDVRRTRDNPAAFGSLVSNILRSQSTGVNAFRDRRPLQEKVKEAEAIARGLFENAPRTSRQRTPAPRSGTRGGTSGGTPRATTDVPEFSGRGDTDVPPGSGTRAAPYRATTQGHVEWFKQKANKGDVIVIDGKPFTKN